MTRFRNVSLLMGGLGAIATIAVIFNPSLESAIPIHRVGMDYLVVGALGIVALLSAGVLFAIRSVRGVAETTPPSVEETQHGRPGDIVEETLDSLPLLRVTDIHHHLYRQLRELTISAVVNRHSCSRSAARERVSNGTWTDDDQAATFLRSAEFVPPSLLARLAAVVLGRRWFKKRVVVTVRSLERLDGSDNS